MRKAKGVTTLGILACAAASPSIIGCHQSPAQTAPPKKLVALKASRPLNAKDLLGISTVNILRNATRVETFRVESGQPKSGQAIVGDCPVIYKGRAQGKVFASQLVRLLLSDKSYFGMGQFNPRKSCIFQPFAAYRVWAKRESVEVCLCFHCEEWNILTKSASGKTTHRAYGSFEGAKSELIALTQKAFPRDKEVRLLNEDE
ncbi:MAG TPA: hypothetical protein VF681_10425 [Abditibacteriaceae bacterium]|jgi:hypothetical protein